MIRKKVLILGGTGFLGQELVKILVSDPSISLIGVGSRSKLKVTSSQVKSHKINVLQLANVLTVCRKYDIIINCTGQVSSPFSNCLLQNSIGINNLIQVCQKQKKKIIQISSILTYGSARLVNEESLLNPESNYAASKASAELLIKQSLPTKQYLIVRLTNLYGSKQTKGILWDILRSYKKGRLLSINDNDGTLRRNFLHVEDAAALISRLIRINAQGIYNLGSQDYYSIREIVKTIESITGGKYRVKYANLPPQSSIDKISFEKLDKRIHPQFKYRVQDFLKQALT